MTLLPERDLTPEEREAIADEPRPGVWVDDPDGDGRAFTQDETDALIGRELWRNVPTSMLGTLSDITGPLREVHLDRHGRLGSAIPLQQRGGIHSDPLVRLLAFRAWGDRDRRWRKRDTAKALGYGAPEPVEVWRKVYAFDGVAIYDQQWKNVVAVQAHRGDREATVELNHGKLVAARSYADAYREIMLDAFDELDLKLEAGDDHRSLAERLAQREMQRLRR